MNYRCVLLVSCCVLIIFEIIVAWPALIHGCPREGFGSEMDCMESHTLNEAPAYCTTMPECLMLCWILPETIIACILLFVFASKWRWTVYIYVVAFWIIPFQIFLCTSVRIQNYNQNLMRTFKKMGCTMADRVDPTNFKCKSSPDSFLPVVELMFTWMIAVFIFIINSTLLFVEIGYRQLAEDCCCCLHVDQNFFRDHPSATDADGVRTDVQYEQVPDPVVLIYKAPEMRKASKELEKGSKGT